MPCSLLAALRSKGRQKWNGALERTRTFDPQLRKLMLYPLSYERVRRVSVP
jgi:hypothetical protein